MGAFFRQHRWAGSFTRWLLRASAVLQDTDVLNPTDLEEMWLEQPRVLNTTWLNTEHLIYFLTRLRYVLDMFHGRSTPGAYNISTPR